MSHDLFGSRFYSLREEPWHRLGLVSDAELTAVEAFNAITPFTVSLEPLYTTIGDTKLELSQRAILRHPVPDDPVYKTLGVVGPDYTLVDPLSMCELFDSHVRKPVETLGALGSGETLFLTARMPSFSVRGDDVDNYMLVVSPYTGLASVQVRLTPVRVVCKNTLMIAKQQSTETYNITHNASVMTKLSIWMNGLLERFEAKSADMIQRFEHLSKVTLDDADIEPLLGLIYVDPKPFSRSLIESENEKREQWFEENRRIVERRRTAVKEVFMGRGMGQDTDAAKGTAWGLFNAVCEYEMYKPSTKPRSAAADMLVGGRADFAERAYDVMFEYARTR